MSADDYHPFIPNPPNAKIAGPTARAHAEARTKNNPRAQGLLANWERMLNGPFRGITTDGHVHSGSVRIAPRGRAHSGDHRSRGPAPCAAGREVAAAEKTRGLRLISNNGGAGRTPKSIWSALGFASRRSARPARRRARGNAREHEPARLRTCTRRDEAQSLSGRHRSRPGVMGEWSYNFCLFGTPSATEPWGWQLFGHHLVLNCFVLGQQMVLTPAFWGAEPNYADHGPFNGIRLFQDEERAGLKLMRSFSPEQQKRAIVAHSMMGGDLPEGRRHFADNLHLGGAFHDNRVVPYEGLKGDALSAMQRRDLMDLVDKYLAVLPEGPRKARIAEVERHLPDTHFCWIGGFSEDQPVLLSGAEPGHLHRVRPPCRRVPDQSGAGEIPRAHDRANAERQRLRLRPVAPALQDVAASPADAETAAAAGAASRARARRRITTAPARIAMTTIMATATTTIITTTRNSRSCDQASRFQPAAGRRLPS